MADQIAQLDAYMALLEQVADELERQVTPCPMTRTLVIAWLTEWAREPGILAQLKHDLPHLPQHLKAAYSAWIHQAEHR